MNYKLYDSSIWSISIAADHVTHIDSLLQFLVFFYTVFNILGTNIETVISNSMAILRLQELS